MVIPLIVGGRSVARRSGRGIFRGAPTAGLHASNSTIGPEAILGLYATALSGRREALT